MEKGRVGVGVETALSIRPVAVWPLQKVVDNQFL